MQLAALLSRFDDVSEVPDGYLARCPGHTDSRPSLRVWVGTDRKARLSCRAGCETDTVRRAAGLQWSDLFDVQGDAVTVPAERPSLVGAGPTAALETYVGHTVTIIGKQDDGWAVRAALYARDRFGLDLDACRDLGVGVDDGEMVDGLRWRSRAFLAYPRLTVPLRNFRGVVHGLQGRDLTGDCPGRWLSLLNPRGARWGLYGVLRGQGGYGVALVTEGPGDGLSVVGVGYDAVVVRGASLASNPDLIGELADGLKGSHVIAAGDRDDAGRAFNRALAEGLKPHGIAVYELPIPDHGPKTDVTQWREADPDDFPAALHRAVKAARPVALGAQAEAQAVSAELTTRTGADAVTPDQGSEAARILAGLIGRYGDSDAMNAHALVTWTDGRIKYAPGLGFYVWDGSVWERSTVKVRQEVHRMGAALVLAGEVQKARGFTMTTRIDALLTELRSVPRVHVDAADFDANPDLLTFRNGTVHLPTGELRPHSPADMLTYRLDLDYRADAECPRWEAFLREIFPDNPELPGFVQRLIGYGITGHTSEQAFAVLWGKGANGKSVMTDTLTAVFRAISKTTPFASFEEKPSGGIPNDIAALRGSRLVMASEGESGKPMSEAVLKRITGKDMISARFLRQEFFEFRPTFLLLLATNHKPRFRGQDEGLWRRVKLVPFRRWFAPEERDYSLDRKLLAESEGIAAWAVAGAVEWYRDGLNDPSVVLKASSEYRQTSDALAGFFPGILERADESAVMLGSDAFNVYLDWAEAENLPMRERWTRRTFYDAMEERGIGRKKTVRGIALIGVRLPESQAAAPGIFAT
ncbi:phage/plasmid primase, P4 family [Kitasatospora purpeofusca]|uniref:phage/plasmid primase, P4 family n=1 Tax=Kitasatospora purpeofusca TaxID=67352 RepID=UPI003815536A